MIVYIIQRSTKSCVIRTTNVQGVYDAELHFVSQKTAREVVEKLSQIIQVSLQSGKSCPLTYAADLSEAIVIPQQGLSVVIADTKIQKYERSYIEFTSKFAVEVGTLLHQQIEESLKS